MPSSKMTPRGLSILAKTLNLSALPSPSASMQRTTRPRPGLASSEPFSSTPTIQLAGRRRRQAGRIADVGRLGEQRHLEARRRLDLAQQAVVAGSPAGEPAAARRRRRRDLVRPVDLDLEDAGPGAALEPGGGHPDVPDAPGEELVRAVLVARVALGLVREHRPRLAVVRALDLVPVVDAVLLPDDADAGQVLGLAQVDLPPLRADSAVRAPAGRRDRRQRRPRADGRGSASRRPSPAFPSTGLPGTTRSRRLEVPVVELVDRPEQAAGDEVEVAGVGDGRVVVAEGRAEDPGLAVVGVGPGDDRLGAALLAAGECMGGRLELAGGVVVELFIDGRPVAERLGDRALAVDDM